MCINSRIQTRRMTICTVLGRVNCVSLDAYSRYEHFYIYIQTMSTICIYICILVFKCGYMFTQTYRAHWYMLTCTSRRTEPIGNCKFRYTWLMGSRSSRRTGPIGTFHPDVPGQLVHVHVQCSLFHVYSDIQSSMVYLHPDAQRSWVYVHPDVQANWYIFFQTYMAHWYMFI